MIAVTPKALLEFAKGLKRKKLYTLARQRPFWIKKVDVAAEMVDFVTSRRKPQRASGRWLRVQSLFPYEFPSSLPLQPHVSCGSGTEMFCHKIYAKHFLRHQNFPFHLRPLEDYHKSSFSSFGKGPAMKRHGLTIVELLVVIAIMAVLIGVMVPAVQRVRETAATNETMGKLKEMALATHSCNDLHKKLPPAYGTFEKVTGTVHVHLLPFAGQDNLHKEWLKAAGRIRGNVVPQFLTPLDFTQPEDEADGQNFLANLRVFSDVGFHLGDEGIFRGITWPTPAEAAAQGMPNPYWGTPSLQRIGLYGTSNTVAFVTGYMNCPNKTSQRLYFNSPGLAANAFFGTAPMTSTASTDGTGKAGTIFQTLPSSRDCDPAIPQAMTGKGILTAVFDGSVHVVNPSINVESWAYSVQANFTPLPDW